MCRCDLSISEAWITKTRTSRHDIIAAQDPGHCRASSHSRAARCASAIRSLVRVMGGWVGYLSGVYQHVGSCFTQIGDQADGFGSVDLTALTPALRPDTFIGGPLT